MQTHAALRRVAFVVMLACLLAVGIACDDFPELHLRNATEHTLTIDGVHVAPGGVYTDFVARIERYEIGIVGDESQTIEHTPEGEPHDWWLRVSGPPLVVTELKRADWEAEATVEAAHVD